jgi:hypothetical protein
MTSAINANAIDATYPIAGVDNDTEGFRNNFNYIKIGLAAAAAEITALQASTGGLNTGEIENGSNFNNRFISDAVFKKNTHSVQDGVATILSGVVTIDLSNADHQHLVLIDAGPFPISFAEGSIPETNSRRVIIELSSADTTARSVTFTEAGAFEILRSANFPSTITFNNSTRRVLIEAITRKIGTSKTVFLNYIGTFE